MPAFSTRTAPSPGQIETIGSPASELENFKVHPTLPGADGSHLVIASVAASTLRGFYVLDLAPNGRAPRRRGLYVFDLVVEKGEDRGQALSSVILT